MTDNKILGTVTERPCLECPKLAEPHQIAELLLDRVTIAALCLRTSYLTMPVEHDADCSTYPIGRDLDEIWHETGRKVWRATIKGDDSDVEIVRAELSIIFFYSYVDFHSGRALSTTIPEKIGLSRTLGGPYCQTYTVV